MDLTLLGIIAYVLFMTIVGLFEKHAVINHHYMHFSMSRVFYMLLLTLIIILIFDPSVLSSKALYTSFKDPVVFWIGILTGLSMFMYYWLLTSKDLFFMTLLWPLIMILTIFGAAIFIKEKITPIQWFGILITFVGLFIVFFKK